MCLQSTNPSSVLKVLYIGQFGEPEEEEPKDQEEG